MKQQSKPKSGGRSSPPSSLPSKTANTYLYEEATGKTIDFIRYVDQSNGSHAFEIRFTDGTFLFIEPLLRVEFRVRYLKTNGGNVKTLRDYGVVSGPPSGK